MKKIFAMVLAIIMVAGCMSVSNVFASDINVTIDGTAQSYDVMPVIENGRTLVPMRAIFESLGAVVSWDDETKTISKRHPEDKFDKELGFLFAYYYKKCGLTKAARKRILECVDYSKIKSFLFEMFVKESKKSPDQARNYLKNLQIA